MDYATTAGILQDQNTNKGTWVIFRLFSDDNSGFINLLKTDDAWLYIILSAMNLRDINIL